MLSYKNKKCIKCRVLVTLAISSKYYETKTMSFDIVFL